MALDLLSLITISYYVPHISSK